MILFLRWSVHIPGLTEYAGRPGMKSQGFSTLRGGLPVGVSDLIGGFRIGLQ
jgi:hypothetical protein